MSTLAFKVIKKIFPKFERPLAWAQLSHQKTRMGVAMGGIAFANVLIFMQLGFLNLFSDGATFKMKIPSGSMVDPKLAVIAF